MPPHMLAPLQSHAGRSCACLSARQSRQGHSAPHRCHRCCILRGYRPGYRPEPQWILS